MKFHKVQLIVQNLVVFLIISFCIYNFVHGEEAIPARPTSHYVLDKTNTLSAGEVAKIDQIAKEVETNKKVSIAVLMIPSLNGEDLAQYSFKVAEQWKPGVDGVGKGALLVIVKNDHKSRLEVSRNLEGELPDATIKGILSESNAHFKRGEFGEGIYDIIRSSGAKTGIAVVEAPAQSDNSDYLIVAILSLFGGAGLFFLKRNMDKEEEKRKKYLAEQEALFRHSEAERDIARRARERREAERDKSAAAAAALSTMSFVPAYSAPLVATAGLSGAQIKKPLDIKKSPEPPKPAPKPVKREETRRETEVYVAPVYVPSSSSRSSSYDSDSSRSSSYDSDSSSSSSSSYSSSSSSDYSGGGSSSSWD